DPKISCETQIELPKARSGHIPAIHGAQCAQSRKRECRGINPTRGCGMGTERVRQHLKGPLVVYAAQLTVLRHGHGEPKSRLRPVDSRCLPSCDHGAKRPISESRCFGDDREIEYMPAIAGEVPAELPRNAVAAVLAPVRWDYQTAAIPSCPVAVGQVADTMRPGVVGVRAHTTAQPLLQTQNQAVIAGRASIIQLVHVGDEAGAS